MTRVGIQRQTEVWSHATKSCAYSRPMWRVSRSRRPPAARTPRGGVDCLRIGSAAEIAQSSSRNRAGNTLRCRVGPRTWGRSRIGRRGRNREMVLIKAWARCDRPSKSLAVPHCERIPARCSLAPVAETEAKTSQDRQNASYCWPNKHAPEGALHDGTPASVTDASLEDSTRGEEKG